LNKEQLKKLEADLWQAANALRANSDLKASEYSTPVLGIIFLRFADNNYKRYEAEIRAEFKKLKGTRLEKPISEIAIVKCGFYLPDDARYDYLLSLPEENDIAKALKHAMQQIAKYKPELDGVLPQDEYFRLTRSEQNKSMPMDLLKIFADIPTGITGDMFGQIYEYFLGEFAMSEGQGGGEFFTPRSVVRLMVEIIEPHGGRVYDPACGSGGMFVQSAQFVEQHRNDVTNDAVSDIYVCGQEKTLETVKLAKMNLAVNGLRGEIKQANTYYEDPFNSFGQFDYVMANPPFNVDDVSLSTVEKDRRFNTYGIPRNKTKGKKAKEGKVTVPNGNYLWINLFATSLKENGRAALVMANSASDARHSEADIRESLIKNNLIYAVLSLPSNMFYTVTLPATLWFFDKAKQEGKILFINARNVFTQIDRAHREFSEEQLQNIAMISKLHKGRRIDFVELIDKYFAEGVKKLTENETHIETLSMQLKQVLDNENGKQLVMEFLNQWKSLSNLQIKFKNYISAQNTMIDPVSKNKAQHNLRAAFDPFFIMLHNELKKLDKSVRIHEKHLSEIAKVDGKRGGGDRLTKTLKTALTALHKEVGTAESWFKHIYWLQERFPQAEYEDITGLCKLASLEEIKEQGYSLNPGRYVGVVIEEDGKTEEEFIDELLMMNNELESLNAESKILEKAIYQNIKQLTGEV
jgi:type I restriction enzyme M protein